MIHIFRESGFGILLLTVEWYLFIELPLKYPLILTRKKTLLVISLQWIVGISNGTFPIIHRNDIIQETLAIVSLNITTIVMYTYRKIWKTLNRHKREILIQITCVEQRKFKHDKQMTITISLVMLSSSGF